MKYFILLSFISCASYNLEKEHPYVQLCVSNMTDDYTIRTCKCGYEEAQKYGFYDKDGVRIKSSEEYSNFLNSEEGQKSIKKCVEGEQ